MIFRFLHHYRHHGLRGKRLNPSAAFIVALSHTIGHVPKIPNAMRLGTQAGCPAGLGPSPSWHSLFFPNHIKMFGRHYRFPHNGEPRSGCNIKIMSRR